MLVPGSGGVMGPSAASGDGNHFAFYTFSTIFKGADIVLSNYDRTATNSNPTHGQTVLVLNQIGASATIANIRIDDATTYLGIGSVTVGWDFGPTYYGTCPGTGKFGFDAAVYQPMVHTFQYDDLLPAPETWVSFEYVIGAVEGDVVTFTFSGTSATAAVNSVSGVTTTGLGAGQFIFAFLPPSNILTLV